MKKTLQRILFTALFILAVSSVYAGSIITAIVNNGAWKTGSTWSGGVVPTTGDIAIIPSNMTVVYTTGYANGGNENWDNPAIYVYGTLKFTSGTNGSLNSLYSPQFNNAANVYFFSGSTFYDSQNANGFYLNNVMSIYNYAGSNYQITSSSGYTNSEFSVNAYNSPVDFTPAIPGTITGMYPVNANNPNNLIVHNGNAPPVVVPLAVTNAATNVTTSSATLNGGLIYSTSVPTSSIIFRYSINADLSSSSTINASVTSLAAGSSVSSLTATPSLLSSTKYYYRLEGVNSAGTGFGVTQSFTTPNAVPIISGTVANQAVNDNATKAPFSAVNIVDPDAAQTQTVTITLDNTAKGSFTTLNGFTNTSGTYTYSGTVANAQAAIRGLVFTPTPNRVAVGSTETTTFTIGVNDGAGGTASNNSTTVVSTSINDAPVLANGSTSSYTENGASAAINSSVTVTDVDNTTLASGTVSITGNFVSGQDVLSFTNVPANMGNIAGTYNSTTGIMSLTSASSTATLAQWQAAFRAVLYSNSSDNPSTSARTVSFSVNDGAAASNVITSTINVTAVNDAPILTGGSTITYTENAAATAINTGITVTDIDNTTLKSAVISISNNFQSSQDVLAFTNTGSTAMGDIVIGSNASGVLNLSSSSGTATLAQWQTALRAVTYVNSSDNPVTTARTVNFTVNDGTTASTAVSSTINITAVNDAPVVANGSTVSYTENGAAAAINTSIIVSDLDNAGLATGTVSIAANFASGQDVLSFTNVPASMGNITGTYSTATGIMSLSSSGNSATPAQWQAAFRAITYTNSSDNPSTPARTVSFSVNDGALASTVVNSTININAVNDAPVFGIGNSTSYIEDGNATVINPAITLSDIDNATLSSASVTIVNFVSGQDILSFTANGATGNITGNFNATTGVMTLSSANNSGTPAQFQAALRTIQYSNSSDNPSTTTRNVTFVVNDGGASNNIGVVSNTINITAVNDAPVLTGSSTVSYVNGTTAVAVSPAITLTDVDSPNMSTATAYISAGFTTNFDILAAVTTGTNITATYTTSSGVLNFSGSDTKANYQQVMRSITYSNSGGTGTSSKIIAFAAFDGSLSSNTVTSTLSVGPPPSVQTAGTLSALSTGQGTASASTSFSLQGFNMQAGILVTPPTGFEVSTNNTTFTPTVTVGTAGTISFTTVYVRLAAADAIGTYSGNIVLSSAGLTSVNVATASSTVKSTDATLSALTASAGTLSSAFSAATTSYSFTTAGSSTTVTATATNAGATLQVQLNGGTYGALTSGTASGSLTLIAGTNTINIKATAADGTTIKIYTITVLRPPGNALAFDGINDAVLLAAPPVTVSGSYTIEAWVKPNTNTGTQNIFSTRNPTDSGFDLKLVDGANIHGDIGTGSAWMSTNADAAFNYVAGQWIHIAYVVTPSAYTIYVNGAPAGTGALPAAGLTAGTPLLTDASHNLYIGYNARDNNYFNGSIDEVKVYNTNLSAANIQADMASTTASVPASLVYYYDFDNGVPGADNTGIALILKDKKGTYDGSLSGFALTGTTSNFVATYATVIPTAPTATNVVTTGFTASWAAVSGATSYQLDVATDNAFATLVTGFNNLTVAGISQAVNGLTPGTTYYYRVRALSTTAGISVNSATATQATLQLPTIASFSPTSAPVGGTIVITGTNFTGATAVSFGGTAAASFVVNSATQITAVVGNGSAGAVSVTAPNGTATKTGFTIAAPTTTIATAVFSNDSGTSTTDFNTNAATQTITGTLSANITAGQIVQVSINNGTSFATATSTVGSNTFSLAGVTLTASNTLLIRVADAIGTAGTAFSQAYTFDATAPTAAVNAITALSNDTGTSATDFITSTAAQTVSGTFTGTLGSGETIQISADAGTTWITAAISGNTVTAAGITLISGVGSITSRTLDVAGNSTAGSSKTYTLDNVTPTATVSTMALSNDTGTSATDFITSIAAQTLTGNLTTTPASGEIVQISLNGGTSWALATVSGNTFTVAGITLAGTGTITSRTLDLAGNIAAGISHTYTFDNTASTITSSGMSFSNDSGADGDLYTNVASQTIQVFLNGTMASGEYGQISVDDGATWVTSTAPPFGINISGATLLSGTHTVSVRIVDAAGNISVILSRSYTLDTTAPTSTIASIDLSDDTGVSAHDYITNVASQTIAGSLSAPLAAGDFMSISLGGSAFQTVTVSGTDFSLAGVTLAAGAHSVEARITDLAGNSNGKLFMYQLDTTAPTATVSSWAFSNDNGISSTDFITSAASQTVTVKYSGTVDISGGDLIQLSTDGGTTWKSGPTSIDPSDFRPNFLIPLTLVTGTNAILSRAIDKAGNITTGPSQTYTLASVPAIASVTPSSGPAGSMITITGSGLISTGTVAIGGVNAVVLSATGTQLVAFVMPGTTGGTVSLSTGLGTATGSSFMVTQTTYPGLLQSGKLRNSTIQSSADGVQGGAVALSADGNTAIVGSYFSVSANIPGGVTMYTRSGNTWSQLGYKITPTSGGDRTGASVAISADGNTAVLGAPTIVNRTTHFSTGGAVIINRSTSSIQPNGPEAVLFGSNAMTNGFQGTSVAISANGNTVMLGGYAVSNALDVWMFQRMDSVWSQQGNKLTATLPAGVTASLLGAGRPGLPGGLKVTLGYDGATASITCSVVDGSAYIWNFVRTAGVWSQQGTVQALSNPAGIPVGVSSADGNTIVRGNADYSITPYTYKNSAWIQHNDAAASGVVNGDQQLVMPVAISADGTTAITSSYTDNNNAGAVWLYGPASSDASLSNLTTSVGTLSPAFVSSTTSYTASVSSATDSIAITPIANETHATIKVNGTVVNSGTASAMIGLNAGADNVITVLVTPQDSSAAKTYTLTVHRDKIDQNITFAALPDKTYGADDFNLTATGGASGNAVVYTSSNTSVAIITGNTVTIKGAGTTVITATQTGTGGFNDATAVPQTLTVNKLGIVVTAVAKNKIFSQADPILTYTYTGTLANADSFTGELSRIAGEASGTYAITQGTLAISNNYTLVYHPANLTISNGTISGVTLPDATVVYDGTLKSLTPVNLPGGATIIYGNNGQINAGVYTVTATISQPNYDDQVITAHLTISKAAITGVTLAGATIAYDGTAKSLVVTGLPPGATVVYTGNAQAAPGTYTVTALVSKANYDDLHLSAVLTIQTSSNALLTSFIIDQPSQINGTGAFTFTTSVSSTTGSIKVTPVSAEANSVIRVNGTVVASGSASPAITLTGASTVITMLVTAQDGITTQTYTLTVYKIGSNNASLTNFTIDQPSQINGTSALSFITGVSATTGSVKITPVSAEANSVIRVNGTVVASGSASPAIMLTGDSTVITMLVTAQDGIATQTYTLTVYKIGSNNASLTNFTIDQPSQINGTGAFTFITGVSSTTGSIKITPVSAEANSVIRVNGTVVASGSASPAITLTGASTVITMLVTAQDGVTTQTYTLTVYKIGSNNASLTNFTIDQPSQINGTGAFTFTTGVIATTGSVKVTPVSAEANSVIRVNGTVVASGSASPAITLTGASTVITMLVTAQDGITTQTYTLTVYKTGSNNASLTSFIIDQPSQINGTGAFTFTTGVIATTGSVKVTPVSAEANSVIRVNGTVVASGSASPAITLTGASTVITMLVTAQDGVTTKTYTLTVYKTGSNNASLTNFTIDQPSQINGTGPLSFITSVSSTTGSVRVTPVSAEENSVIRVNGTVVASGSASQAITLTGASTVITMLVTAQDGVTTQTYTLTVYKTGSNNASLTSFITDQPSQINGTGAFTFITSVSGTTGSIKVTPVSAEANSVIRVNGTVVASGSASPAITLTGDSTVITLLVTAQDGVTTQTYTLTVYKEAQVATFAVTLRQPVVDNQASNVTLYWQATGGKGSSSYQVQKLDGGDYTNIATVKGNGTGSYTAQDRDPLNGSSYYRIAATDSRGKIAYSQPVNLKLLTGGKGIVVYPNPVKDKQLVLNFVKMPQGTYDLILAEPAGDAVLRTRINYDGVSPSVAINISNIRFGVYILNVSSGSYVKALRVVVE